MELHYRKILRSFKLVFTNEAGIINSVVNLIFLIVEKHFTRKI